MWDKYYGLISGLAFTGTFAIFGLLGGVISDRLNRKWIIIISSICWSACSLLSGTIVSFPFFVIMRVCLGFFEAFLEPAAYSMLSDYFPESMRTRANSVFNLSIYFGSAFSSLSQLIILQFGWKISY